MEREIGYHAINMCDIPLKVYDKEGKMQIGTIIEKERFVIMDSWTSSDNNYINSKVKFVNDNGEFSYGYLYDVSYPKQVSSLSEWTKVQGLIDTKININPFSTSVHGMSNDENEVIE